MNYEGSSSGVVGRVGITFKPKSISNPEIEILRLMNYAR